MNLSHIRFTCQRFAVVVVTVALAPITLGCATNPTVSSDATPRQAPVTATPTVTPAPKDMTASVIPAVDGNAASTSRLRFNVVRTVPHDTTAFTQGLEFHNGKLYESRGLYGAQETTILTEISPTDGTQIIQSAPRPTSTDVFAEGITVVDDRIIQLTWKAEEAYVYDRDTLAHTNTFAYTGEGWGLCDRYPDGQSGAAELVMSNGSNQLVFRNPETFVETRSVSVTNATGAPIDQINELECVGDRVLANVWNTNRILVINPADGVVESEIEISEFADTAGRWLESPRNGAVLNGIAYNPETNELYITGKQWPVMLVGSLECVSGCNATHRKHFQRLAPTDLQTRMF